MNFDPKAVRRALMVAKNLATSIDPGFANITPPMPPEGVPLERAKGGPIKTVQGPEREQNLAEFMRGAHPEFLDQEGRARKFYHITPKSFSQFKPGGTKEQQQLSGPAIFMSADPEIQNAAHNVGGFGGEFKPGSNVMVLHANVKNPLIIDKSNYASLKKNYPGMGVGAYLLSPEVKADLEDMGYDGIINKLKDDPRQHEFMAFYPWQVKSAFNKGTFDPSVNDITKAEGGSVDDELRQRKLNNMGMYSAAAEAARNLPQERGTLQQMLATMKGVKPDEIDWSGVQQKFAGQKTVTRDELAQHFENSMPPVKDSIRSTEKRIGEVPRYDAYTIPGGQNYKEFVLHMPKEDVAQAYPGEVMHFRSSHWSEPNVIAHLRTKDRMLTQREKLPKSDTQIDIALRDPTEPRRTVNAWTTQTPGLVVTKSLDEKGLYNVTHIDSGLATNTQVGSLPFHQAMDAARRLGEYYDGWTSPGDEIKAQLQQKLPEIKNIISSSINPRAKKALHLEELQSDWAQKGRDESFVDSEKVKKANAELQNYRQSMRDEYERSLIDRLQKGQPIKDEEKEQMLAGQYKDLYDLRKSFEDTQGAKIDTGNEFQVRTIFPDVRELPFENDKKGLFLYDNNSGEMIDDEKLWPDSQDRLNRMRKAFEEIQNFEKYAKENPEWLAENVNEYVYGLEPKIIARHLGDHAFAKHVRMTDDLNNMLKGIDEGPFVTSTNQWTDLGLKRALVEAARGNYDKLIWTPGKDQAQRYKLNNFIDALSYKKSDDGYYDIVASKRGNKVHSDRYKPEDLPGVVGQEMAKKIIAGEGDDKPDPVNPSAGKGSKFIRGLDLNVGGRGMYEYYDKILPRRLLALAQEHDPEAKILPTSNTVGKLNKFPSLDITPRMRQSILKRGFRMFARGGAVQKHLFDQAIEPVQVNMPEMDRQKVIRRALMIAKAEGGTVEKPAKVRKTAMDFLPESLPDVSINSLTKAFTEGINEHLALPEKERIQNSRAAKKVIASRNGSGALLAKNGKLMKTETGAGDSDPVELPDGRGIETTGLSLAPAFQVGKFNTCPNHASCKASCLGVTSGGNFMFGGGRDLEEIKGPRLAHLKNTLAMILHPKEFAVRLNDEITAAKQQAAVNGNKLGVRLNVLSDIHPRAYEALINAHPDVDFYDYTKLDSNPVAPNHHLTYSSTGVAQPAGVNGNMTDVDNEHQNWRRMRRRLDTGSNVAMAFSHGSVLPEFVHDLESGKRYRVVNGDDHDFRPMDRQPEGSDGVIVGLKNKKAFGKEQEAHIDSNGFFTYYDPKIVKDAMGNNMVTNNTVQVAPQPGARRMMTNDSVPEERQNG